MQHTIHGIVLEHGAQLGGGYFEYNTNMGTRCYAPCANYVVAELVPLEGQWWLDPVQYPEAWEYAIEGDAVPDWYCQTLQESLFRQEAQEWWRTHVLVNQELEELESGFYYLKYCKVKTLTGTVRVICQDTEIGYMDGNAVVVELGSNSRISRMSGYSRAEFLFKNSSINSMEGFSFVKCLADYSVVGEMKEHSQIGVMYGNSTVKAMYNYSRIGGVCDRGLIRCMQDHSMISILEDSSVVYRMGDHAVVCRISDASIYKTGDFSCIQTLWGHSVVEEMSGRSYIQEIHEHSIVKRMSEYSCIYALYGNAVVLDMTDGAGIYEVYSSLFGCFAKRFKRKIRFRRFRNIRKDHWRIMSQKTGMHISIKNSD